MSSVLAHLLSPRSEPSIPIPSTSTSSQQHSYHSPSSFTIECIFPSETTNFVTAPNARGTLEILQSGVLCIFVCIWTVQHLNVPAQRDGRSRGLRGKLYWQWRALSPRLKWMLVTLILPEFLLGKALSDFMGARESMSRVREMRIGGGKELSVEEVEGWTKVHAFYGDMGGFVLRTRRPRADGQGFALQHLVSEEVLTLRETGRISRLPSIHKDMINAMSKGDVFVKLLAVFEVVWMVVEVLFRKAYDLPISQLEITACAFCSTTLVTYALWWTKPQGVRIATILELSPSSSTELLFEPRLPGFWRYRLAQFDSDKLRQRDMPDEPVWNDSVHARKLHSIPLLPSNMAILDIGILLGSILAGGIHLSAWNFQFPTTIERILWRYCSIAIIATTPFYFLISATVTSIEKLFRKYKSTWGEKFVVNEGEVRIQAGILGFGTGVVYMCARLFLLGETVYSLFYLPPRAYVTTWSQVFPHAL